MDTGHHRLDHPLYSFAGEILMLMCLLLRGNQHISPFVPKNWAESGKETEMEKQNGVPMICFFPVWGFYNASPFTYKTDGSLACQKFPSDGTRRCPEKPLMTKLCRTFLSLFWGALIRSTGITQCRANLCSWRVRLPHTSAHTHPLYTKVKVLSTQDKQHVSWAELRCHCLIKDLATAGWPEYVATHSPRLTA